MKRVIPLLLALLLLSSCTSILETEHLEITPHAELELQEPNPETPEAANRTELRAALYSIFRRAQSSGNVNVFEYDGDLAADAAAIRDEIFLRDAVASYALSDMLVTVTPIVSYFEVHAEFTYSRAREEIDGITNAATLRYLRSELLDMLGKYRSAAAIRTSLPNVTEADVLAYITEIYYDNPLLIIMPPITTAETYPEAPPAGGERVIALTFGYSQPTQVLEQFGGWLRSATGDVAAAAAGTNDAEILLSLCRGLAELADYDQAAAELSEYPTQSLSATAYGALLGGSAIGEGYAMAYKALCDELSIPCRVVLGSRNGLPHAWNIATFDGAYYHIDPSLCDTDGFAAGFFKTDAQMADKYEWNREAYPVCSGKATYEDIAG